MFARANITAALTHRIKQFAVKAPHYRVVWTIGGTTPNFHVPGAGARRCSEDDVDPAQLHPLDGTTGT